MTRRRKGIPGLSFSWKRAVGISSAKANVSRKIGIPLTRSGRRQRMRKAKGTLLTFIVGLFLVWMFVHWLSQL
ncbi:hypothetical protein EO087_13155 [Dyella sp. M7H15-1]|nr:hypothetical protein EO087_13155 [Dyella sp. M7H15-1]